MQKHWLVPSTLSLKIKVLRTHLKASRVMVRSGDSAGLAMTYFTPFLCPFAYLFAEKRVSLSF